MNKWTVSHDANHYKIIDHFKEQKVQVIDMSGVGGGFPDLLIRIGLVSAFVEIKVPGSKLSLRQQEWRAKNSSWLIFVAQNEEDVDRIVIRLLEINGFFKNTFVCPHGHDNSDLCPSCCH